MGKYNINDILNELGMGGDGPDKGNKPGSQHRIDREQQAFSPLPSVPANQPMPDRLDDPAVKGPTPAPPGKSTVPSALNDFYRPEEERESSATDLGELLVSRGLATEERVAQARVLVKQSVGKRLADALLEQGVDEVAVQSAVAEMSGVPFERINLEKGLDGGFDGVLLQRLTLDFCKQNMVVPLRMEGHRAVVGSVRADDAFLADDVRHRLGVSGIKLVLVTSFDIKGVMEIIGGVAEEQVDVSQLLAEVAENDVTVDKNKSEEMDLTSEANGSPVIKIVNHIIQKAVAEGASDIHVEPAEKKLKVRFRIDGELYEMVNPPASMSAAVTSRLKIMANLDISERRMPQDGRIRCKVGGRQLDLRVSTIPSSAGEKTVMRILDQKSISVDLEQLGFDDNTLSIWKNQINAPHGIVLVTGPTGSGKTTTLYASLRTLDKNSMNISTVEDPVEYHLEGITQTQTHEKIGMTFAVALRALLRQDPDVILMGEIRDHETAHIAVQAALTGHLVLSTLHTNDAPSSVTRLVNIGLEPFLVGAALNAVLAQRLIRRLCSQCKAEEAPSQDMLEYLELQGMPTDKLWVAKGCEKCRKTGYSGRVGLYELLAVDDQLRDVIARNPNVSEFRRLCIERGMGTLRADGMRKVAKGQTTVQEVLRVTEASH